MRSRFARVPLLDSSSWPMRLPVYGSAISGRSGRHPASKSSVDLSEVPQELNHHPRSAHDASRSTC